MLYGNDMNETVTPLEVPLKWTVKLEKPGFIGKQALISRPISKKLVGFEVLEKRKRDMEIRYKLMARPLVL